MTKRADFLYAVQTVYLADCMRVRAKQDPTNDELTYVSPEFIVGKMHDILYAADRIPDEMSASEAAHSFCFYMLENLCEGEERATGVKQELPRWFARR